MIVFLLTLEQHMRFFPSLCPVFVSFDFGDRIWMSGVQKNKLLVGIAKIFFHRCWDSVEFGIISMFFNAFESNLDDFWGLRDKLET